LGTQGQEGGEIGKIGGNMVSVPNLGEIGWEVPEWDGSRGHPIPG